ncbi:MAG: cell division protein FtsX [Sandaracinaceae bacterium]
MNLRTAMTRAMRAMREDAKLHLVSVSSLTVAFLCLATALCVVANLSGVADAWGRSARMSVYLGEGAEASDIEQLRLVLEGLPEVDTVQHVTSAAARTQFLDDAELGAELSSLPADVFPASLELEIAAGTSAERMGAIAARIDRFDSVDQVETYQGWFDRLESLLTTGRIASIALTLLVLMCVLFVVANTIRLAIAGRRDEIEVLKLCGASNGFVRGPFLVEGAAQGFISALLAVIILFAAYVAVRQDFDATFASLAGIRSVFLSPFVALALIGGGALVGATGSALSLRRYLVV